MIKKITAVKFLIVVIITCLSIIVLKNNEELKNSFHTHVFNNNISFASINSWYQEKFGNVLPFNDLVTDVPVFNEQLIYEEATIYKDGVSLKVSNNLIPAIDSGIVTFIGEKEGYGNTVIIEQADGVVIWYSNLSAVNIKIYDYVKTSQAVGEVTENLYLVFYKDGVVANYEDYI